MQIDNRFVRAYQIVDFSPQKRGQLHNLIRFGRPFALFNGDVSRPAKSQEGGDFFLRLAPGLSRFGDTLPKNTRIRFMRLRTWGTPSASIVVRGLYKVNQFCAVSRYFVKRKSIAVLRLYCRRAGLMRFYALK